MPITTSSPQITSTDPRTALAEAIDVAGATVAGVHPEHLSQPTPCGEDVHWLLGHMTMALMRAGAAGRGDDVATWPEHVTDVADGDWAARWRAEVPPVAAAWDDEATLARPTTVQWGTFPGAEIVGVYTSELVVHAWDLARATGQTPTWSDATLRLALAAMQAQMPAEGRAELFDALKAELPEADWEAPFGPAVEVPADAPLLDQLLGWTGRTP